MPSHLQDSDDSKRAADIETAEEGMVELHVEGGDGSDIDEEDEEENEIVMTEGETHHPAQAASVFSDQQLKDIEQCRELLKSILKEKNICQGVAVGRFGVLVRSEYFPFALTRPFPVPARPVSKGHVWIWELLGVTPTCPYCKKSDKVKMHQYQWRRVVCQEESSWLLYHTHLCESCKERDEAAKANGTERRHYTFTGIDPDVMMLAPQHLAHQFPFVSTNAAKNSLLIEKTIVHRMITLASTQGTPLAALVRSVQEEHERHYVEQARRYVSFLLNQRREGALSESSDVLPPSFPRPDQCRELYVPSHHTFRELMLTILNKRDPLWTRLLSQIDGRVLSGDHSHKVVAYIFQGKGSKSYHAYVRQPVFCGTMVSIVRTCTI
jgi:hypothetical protein